MAHILGNRYCIDSLRNDVTDLQGAVVDVLSRAGPVRFPSWKYPDRTSCDLDLTELLEIHDYSDDKEECEVAHVVLLELVIDRLVLFLQSMSKFTDQILHSGKGGPSPLSTSNSSIGIVVKKYWNKMVQLGTHTKHIQTENKNKVRLIADLENTVSKMMENDSRCFGSSEPNISVPMNTPLNPHLATGTSSSEYSISRDECIKATQTVETAFVPCESCDIVQKHFRDIGSTVVDICTTQDLPSLLAPHVAQMRKLGWMCGSDVARWGIQQKKDLIRINKHLSDLHATIQPLQSELESERSTNIRLTNRVSECNKQVKLERETQSVQQKQYENKLVGMEKKCHEAIIRVQRQNTDLQTGRDQLQAQIERMKQELQKQQHKLEKLDAVDNEKIRELRKKMTTNVHRLESELETTQQKLSDIREELTSVKKELSREKARGKGVSKHTESLQDKQEGLIHRLDAMDEENEDLRSQLTNLEEEKDQLEEKMCTLNDDKRELKINLEAEKNIIKILTVEKEKLKQTIQDLRSNIHRMEIQVHELQEHGRLLVEYPDLNGPVNPDLSGTGELAVDMENQIKANGIRISVLEAENNKLRHSITKVLGLHQHNKVQQISSDPLALWKVDDSSVQDNILSNFGNELQLPESEHQSANSDISNYVPTSTLRTINPRNKITGEQHSFVVGKRTKTGPTQPPSGKLTKGVIPQATTSINTYKQLKKAGLLKVNQTCPPPAKTMQADDSDLYHPTETFSCPKCDKMYNSARDLDMHTSYCYGGI